MLWNAIAEGKQLHRLVTRHTVAEAQIHRPQILPIRDPKHAPSASTRVLVAEDNRVNQKLAKRLLEKSGCLVDLAVNGKEAIQMWEQHRYDVIFMDCQMPEMDGYEAAREIRLIEGGRAHIPIAALTANAMVGDREKCMAAGMDAFIAKPIKMESFTDTIDQLFGAAVGNTGIIS
jgi:CheY-like chemotaxis protein